ncbi:hypothetical protein DB88DRAFT_482226 [Papiliotrema laurentii]|uniref:Uncharacterized protein n=1 Tax=Papiliotrema laurentii TaxID=5418 RepID=A0AAD9L8I3_PAPLA|nr:hypothetical protein DB88DRAFT_482226 [Papiliotrema laurentii]
MALRDTACYTLTINPSANNVDFAELTETNARGQSEARYVRMREQKEGEAYSGVIYDAFSGAKLGSMGFVSAKDKKRRLELHNPDENVSFEFTGKINFEWTFVFEGLKYRWTREVYGKDYICSLDRKPDPRVEICLARGGDKKEPGRLQILHYNIDRFPDEIKDLRGLETLLVASLMMIIDANDERALKPGSTAQRPSLSASSSSSNSVIPPPLPEKPPKLISEEDYEPENPNEIIVGLQTDIDEHVARAANLLEDPQTLFIVVRTRNPEAAQRALEVSLGVTRFRHRENMGDLHQYVIEEEPFKPPSPRPTSRPGPPVINLDDSPPPSKPERSKSSGKNAAATWKAPNIAIYLSKIDLPDLKPGRRETLKARRNGGDVSSGDQSPPSGSVGPSLSNRLQRPNNALPRPSSLSPSTLSRSAPPPPARPSQGTQLDHGAAATTPQAQAKSSSSGTSLTRLFKAAASKV